jgi:hypothetical protein
VLRRAALPVALFVAITLAISGEASAQQTAAPSGSSSPTTSSEPPSDVDTADGSDDCRAFQDKNSRELAAWEKSQPPVPYRYPREREFLNAPWGNFFGYVGHAGELVLATVLPHIGAQFRGDAPAALVSWPWSVLVIGPYYACSRKKNTFVVHGHRVHRFLIEPGVVSSKLGVGVFTRIGYRFIWHPSGWVVGPGLGLGSTFEIAGNREPFRYSVGPEALVHFGNCCSSSYFTLAFRYDHYFKGTNRDIIGGSLGYTFF